jgi:aspartate aminotransferase
MVDVIQVSKRAQKIKPSATLALAARARELKAAGKDIIDLSVGEPDFPTPEFIKKAAIKAINENFTKYTAVDGVLELKKAIVTKLAVDNKLSYLPEQILVSSGAKHSLYNLFQALLDPEDEVIIPAPFWVSYPEMVTLGEGKPVVVKTNIGQKFKITPLGLEQAITKKTKAFIINSPSNPSGMAYSKEELLGLAEVLAKHPQIVVISDDIYEHILWSMPFLNILNVKSELYDRTVIVNGVSKSHAMTGWRIGFAAGPKEIIAAMKKIQSQSTSNPASISQIASLAAWTGDKNCLKEMKAEFKRRHDLVYQTLNSLKGFKILPSDGTFYSFPNVEGVKGYKSDSLLSEALLNEAEIAVVPGVEFGLPGYLRISYALDTKKLVEALERLKKYFA